MSDQWTPGHDGRPRREPTPAEAMTLPLSQRDRVVTPDGVPLAAWWRRLLAYWIDGFLVSLAVQALLLPVGLLGPTSWFGSMPADLVADAWMRPGSGAWWHATLSISLTLVASAAYAIPMLHRLGWTVGKRILGIRVRHRERERRVTLRESTVRWAVQLAPGALSTIPWIGGAAGLWVAIDGLRPLIWNDRRQAFHDSAAGTSVVMA